MEWILQKRYLHYKITRNANKYLFGRKIIYHVIRLEVFKKHNGITIFFSQGCCEEFLNANTRMLQKKIYCSIHHKKGIYGKP